MSFKLLDSIHWDDYDSYLILRLALKQEQKTQGMPIRKDSIIHFIIVIADTLLNVLGYYVHWKGIPKL